MRRSSSVMFFFFNDTATTEIYTLSLHDALPICARELEGERPVDPDPADPELHRTARLAAQLLHGLIVLPPLGDRKSTRLNSSHSQISYAVFCLKKKNKQYDLQTRTVHILIQLII